MSDVTVSRERLEALETVAEAVSQMRKEYVGIRPVSTCESAAYMALDALAAIEAREANPMRVPYYYNESHGQFYDCDKNDLSVDQINFIISRVNAPPRTPAEEALIEAVLVNVGDPSKNVMKTPVDKAVIAVRAERQKGAK